MEQPQSSVAQQITPRECRIVGQLVFDHAMSYALTATVDVPLPVEIPKQPFISRATLDYIQPFLKIVGYQGLVDKQKKNVIWYPRITKLIIANIMKKYESIPKRLEEDYHSIKDDTSLVNVYTAGKVTVKGMLIPDDLLTDEIQDTQAYNHYKEKYEGVEVLMIQQELVESTQGMNRIPRATSTPNPADVVQKKKGKRAARETSTPRPYLKVHIRQHKPSTTIPPPSDDRERNEIHEATLLSLVIHKTSKTAKEQENVAAVEEKILEEDVVKIVEVKDEESYASEFVDKVLLNDEDSNDRFEPESHKDKPENIDDDDDVDDEMMIMITMTMH
ncbi:hypothetical protein Tco_0111405 [Tanacetum coccineum]